jgi:VanZ family protein
MFIATHLPIQETLGEPPVPDKLAHFVIYGGLGFLLPMWTGWRSRLTWRRSSLCLAAIVVYAVIDEVTQIPVGRSAEWLDGLADLCGAALGIAAAALIGNNGSATDGTQIIPGES